MPDTNFIVPNDVSRMTMNIQLKKAYEDWKYYYLKQVGTKPASFYIKYDENGSTVSEAHGYGMLVMVGISAFDTNAKGYFDGMFRYFKEHPSCINPVFMAWKQVYKNGSMVDEEIGNTDSATDGDMDIAYALLSADKLWGSGGEINYKKEAVTIIGALMDSIVNKKEWILKLGDWAQVDDPKFGTASRTSDWMLGHLDLFYRETGDNRWKKTFDKIIETIGILQKKYSPKTGLLSDFVWKKSSKISPVNPDFLEGSYDPYYYYNACRTPWRMSAGYAAVQNPLLKKQLDNINHWVKSYTGQDPGKIRAGYKLDGRPLADYPDMCFIAPFAASASIDKENQEWLNKLWKRMTEYYNPRYDRNYYNDSLRLLVMMSILSYGGKG